MQSSNRMASNVSMSTATTSFPSGFFNSCNIQGNVQVFFGLQSRSDDKKWLDFLRHFVSDLLITQFWFSFQSDCLFQDKRRSIQIWHFDVICHLLLNRRTATWNLFVNLITLQISSQFYCTALQTSNKNCADHQLRNMVMTGHVILGQDNVDVWLLWRIEAFWLLNRNEKTFKEII